MKQFITSDVNLACLLAFMGYRFKLKSDPTGYQFLFEDSDITTSGILDDYENGVQVADAKGLLEMKDTFTEEMRPNRRTK